MEINIAYCEDQIEYHTILKEILHEVNPNICVDFFLNGKDLFASGKQYHLVIMDIDLKVEDGIKISKQLQPITHNIVFFTNYRDRMQDAFEKNVIGYILKTEPKQVIYDKLCKIFKQIEKKNSIIFDTINGKQTFPIEHIVKIEVISRKFYITTYPNKKLQVYGKNLESIHEHCANFLIRCNRSCIVNPSHILKIESNEILLSDGSCETIGRTWHKRFYQQLLDYGENEYA